MQNSEDLVSIIIPFYNAEKYIDRCVSSILNQTYKNIEAVFVSDGSNDNSISKVNKYKNETIKIYSIDKSGVSVARNFGIDKANGKYITFMDVDDELTDNFVEKLVETIGREKTDIVLCNYLEIYSDGKSKENLLPWKETKFNSKEIKEKLIANMIYSEKNEYHIDGLVWRMITTKKLIVDNNIRFVKGIKVAEDMLFTIQLYNRANSIYFLNDCLYKYYKSKNSSMNKYYENFFEEQLIYHKEFVSILKKEKLYEANKSRYLKNRLKMYTISISNEIRNKNGSIKEKYKRIKYIRTKYLEDGERYEKLNIPIEYKISLILLRYNFIIILLIIYSIKEKIRMSNFK